MRKKKEESMRATNPNVMGLRATVEEQDISDTLVENYRAHQTSELPVLHRQAAP